MPVEDEDIPGDDFPPTEEEELLSLRQDEPVLTVVYYGPGRTDDDVAGVRVGEVRGKRVLEVTSTSDNRALERVAERIARATIYKHTDAWRGYYDTPSRTGEMVQVVGTWVSPMGHSGDWETVHQVPLEKLVQHWKVHVPHYPVYIAYARTSNLFSVTFDIYTARKNVHKLVEFLRKFGVDEKDFTKDADVIFLDARPKNVRSYRDELPPGRRE